MSDMDLIPGDYRQNRGLQSLVKKFILLCVLAMGLVGLTRILLTYLIWRENVQVVRLEQQEQISEQNKSKTETYRRQMQVTQLQLTALNELRGQDRVAVYLAAIDESFSEGIWFDDVHFMRSRATGTLDNVPGASKAGILVVPTSVDTKGAPDGNQGVQISGHAVNHSLLAEFMRKLGAHKNVADIRLIDTSTRSYTTTQVVDFKLALQMKKVQGPQ